MVWSNHWRGRFQQVTSVLLVLLVTVHLAGDKCPVLTEEV